jgi:hypothetical protein
METLTPAQRVATIAIGLALTVMIAIWVLPWASDQIVARLPPTKTPMPPTLTPTATVAPTETPGPTPTSTVALTPPPRAVLLEPIAYAIQAPDNCNLAPLGMALTFWGYTDTHEVIEPVVCPGTIDAFVNTDELSAYAATREMETFVGVNGDLETLRRFLSNGFPAIVTRWLTTTTGVERPQYQFVRGYDEPNETLTIHDFVTGPDVELAYSEMTQSWQLYNYQYTLVYPSQQQEDIRAILGDHWDDEAMWASARDRAQEQVDDDDQDAAAWMNLGSALVALQEYDQAKEAFDRAQELDLPVRLLRYRFEIYDCLFALADYEGLLALTQAVLDEGARVEEIHLYRAQAYVALNDADQARAEYERALEIHPEWTPAQDGLTALSQ